MIVFLPIGHHVLDKKFVFCEADKLNIEDQLNIFYDSITNRLLPAFSSIEEEANVIEEDSLSIRSENFNPDTMDEGQIIEDAYFDGVNHYLLHNQMKQSFLNVSTLWLYHLFEQQLNNISLKIIKNFDYTKNRPMPAIQRIKECFKERGLNNSSNWIKINEELRLLANTLKHADGSSKRQLEIKRPDLFRESYNNKKDVSIPLFENEICVSELDFQSYYQAIKEFWKEFFDEFQVGVLNTMCKG